MLEHNHHVYMIAKDIQEKYALTAIGIYAFVWGAVLSFAWHGGWLISKEMVGVTLILLFPFGGLCEKIADRGTKKSQEYVIEHLTNETD